MNKWTKTGWIAAVLAGALVLGVIPFGAKTPSELDTSSVVTPGKLATLYDKWVKQHEALGGDHNVVVPVGFSKGLTDEKVRASGNVRLDLIEGIVEANVDGLDPSATWDLWLVDNAPNSSVMVEPEDRMKRVGAFTFEGKRAHLRAELGAWTFDLFDVDVVAVTRGGQLPVAPAIAYGMPRSFQRLYTRNRMGTLASYVKSELSKDDQLSSTFQSTASAAGTVVDPDVVLDSMVALGANLFINETFGGNGRTCNSCHPSANNFTLDAEFIATLPDNDPLFVAEFNPALAALEKPVLMREHALILENVDGFSNPGVMRSVPHTLALSTSIAPPTCMDPNGCQAGPLFYTYGQMAPEVDVSNSASSGFPEVSPGVSYPLERTGWGGDGAPGSGTLREFAIGAVIQHATKRLDRVPGVDFRLPTDVELDALEVFQLSLGRSEDLKIADMDFRSADVAEGRDIFSRTDTEGGTKQAGKCVICHANAGANTDAEGFGAIVSRFGLSPHFVGNQIFNTGLTTLPAKANQTLPGSAPRDAGFGRLSLNPGDCMTGDFVLGPTGPQFVPGGTAPGGFGTRGATPFVPPNLCIEAFNVPPLVEAADTAPFFHDNSFDTLEEAVGFYSTPAFNNDSLIKLFVTFTDSGLKGIDLTQDSTNKVAKFLRVINSLENLRSAKELVNGARSTTRTNSDQLLNQAALELDDGKLVLMQVNLHPLAALKIAGARAHVLLAKSLWGQGALWQHHVNKAIESIDDARALMIR